MPIAKWESIRKRDVPGMNIEQNEPSRPSEHFRDVIRVGPSVAEQFLQMLDMFVPHVLLEVGHFLWPLRAGKIEHEWALHDRDLDGAQFIIRADEFRHVMARNLVNSFGRQNLVYLPFAFKALGSVEELDCRDAIRTLDEAVLSGAGAEASAEPAAMAYFVLPHSRINHANSPQCPARQ